MRAAKLVISRFYNIFAVTPFQPSHGEMRSRNLLKVVDERIVHRRTAECANEGQGLRSDLLRHHHPEAGCHLCEDARAVIERVTADLGVSWSERDITQSEEDLKAYSEMIPVTLIDGVQHDYWRVSEDRLRAALRPR